MQEILDCVEQPRERELVAMDAFRYIRQFGVAKKSDYPGTGLIKKSCQQNFSSQRTKIKFYNLVTPGDEIALKTAVTIFGPLSVSIKVTTNFIFYKSGVFFDPSCNDGQRSTNHAVLLVGYGTSNFAGDYWIVQNSWGTWWGEGGFARITRNTLLNCEISSAALYPTF